MGVTAGTEKAHGALDMLGAGLGAAGPSAQNYLGLVRVGVLSHDALVVEDILEGLAGEAPAEAHTAGCLGRPMLAGLGRALAGRVPGIGVWDGPGTQGSGWGCLAALWERLMGDKRGRTLCSRGC